jgi:hypothetical protein
MVMDFTDASISINDSTDVLDYNSQGTVSSTTGALLGPGSKLTYSAPSAKLTEQADGYLGFQAHNLLLQSEAHGTSPWNTAIGGVGVAATRTNGYASGPFGGSATRIQFSLGGGTTTSDISAVQQSVTPPVIGGTYTRDVWIRSTDGSSSYVMQVQDVSGAATNVAITGTWTKYTVTGVSVGSINLSLRLRGGQTSGAGANSNTADVLVANDHLRRTPSVSTYVATTSAAVYDLPYVYSSGVKTGILVEPAATNLCLYSRDLTNAAWIKTSASAALTATGIDGIANSASTLTATSANGVAIQNISSASAARSVAISLKRRTGTGTVTISHGATTGSTLVTNGTFASDVTSWTSHNSGVVTFASGTLQVQESGNVNPAAYQAVTVTAGKMYKLTGTSAVTGGTGSARVSVYDTAPVTTLLGNAAITGGAAATGSFVFRASDTQVSIVLIIVSASAGATATFDNIELLEVAETDVTSSINADTWTRVSILNETITNPAVCIKLATSGDAVDVDIAQTETGTVATSPIITYGAAVTRAADNITLATSLWPYQQNLSILVEWSDGPYINGRIVSLYGAANIRYFDLHRSSSPNLSNYTNHTNGGYMPGVNPSNFTGAHKYAVRYEDSNFKSATDGTLGTADTDIVVNVVATTLAIGGYPAGTTVGAMGITRIALVTRSWSDAELQAVTT